MENQSIHVKPIWVATNGKGACVASIKHFPGGSNLEHLNRYDKVPNAIGWHAAPNHDKTANVFTDGYKLHCCILLYCMPVRLFYICNLSSIELNKWKQKFLWKATDKKVSKVQFKSVHRLSLVFPFPFFMLELFAG